MAYTEYDPTTWRNELAPKINADNLNKIESGVYNNSVHINELDDGKVDKETGKGLSANDFTDADKEKLDSIIIEEVTNASLGQGYGTCSTATGTQRKTVIFADYEKVLGGIVAVKFDNDVGSNASLNINGTTPSGGGAIYYKGSQITDGVIKAGDLAYFIYYNSNYYLLGTDRPQITPIYTYSYTPSGSAFNWTYTLNSIYTPEQLASIKVSAFIDGGTGDALNYVLGKVTKASYEQIGSTLVTIINVSFPAEITSSYTIVVESAIENEGEWSTKSGGDYIYETAAASSSTVWAYTVPGENYTEEEIESMKFYCCVKSGSATTNLAPAIQWSASVISGTGTRFLVTFNSMLYPASGKYIVAKGGIKDEGTWVVTM